MRSVEATLRVLRDAGLTVESALRVFQTCSSYAAGYALAEVTRTADPPGGANRIIPIDRRRPDPLEFPHLAALVTYYTDRDRDAEFEFGLDAVLLGLRAKLQA